jgi:hypothetical protein
MPARGRSDRSSSSGFGPSINEPPEGGDADPRMNRHCRIGRNITRTFKARHQNFFATATEAPSQTLALMKYFLLAVIVVAALYSGAKWLTMK